MVTATRDAEVLRPTDEAAVAEAVRAAHDVRQSIQPMGGRTSLNYGNATATASHQIDLTTLDRIVDYTPRDMTIVVEAGVRMADLAATLSAEGQQLPIDVPRAAEATIGGVTATNWTGPRRLGYGTMRDYLIGIHAVDGRGVAFKGGGRVVKNVAGYDFCKLLTGSLGTLGILTQLALRVRPVPEGTTTVAARCADLATAEIILSRFLNLAATPAAIDVLLGTAWRIDDSLRVTDSSEHGFREDPVIVVQIEGADRERSWLADDITYQMWNAGATTVANLTPSDAVALWNAQVNFADRGPGASPDNASLVLKIAVPPSAVIATIAELRSHDPACTIQAHAANGIVVVRFAMFAAAQVNTVLVGKLRPAAIARGGSLIVLSSTLESFTPHIAWGGRTDATVLMERVKLQFDPHNILNPGRFVY